MVSELFGNLAGFVALVIVGINIIIMFIRAHHHMIYFELLHDKHKKLIKQIPYYNTNYHSNNRSKILFTTLKRSFTFKVFSNKKSKEYFNEWLGMDLINKTKDVKLINKTKTAVMWWVLSDFFKGIFFVYMILLTILVVILEVI